MQQRTFQKINVLLIQVLIEGIIHILNSFLSKTGISQTMSPAIIVEGVQVTGIILELLYQTRYHRGSLVFEKIYRCTCSVQCLNLP